MNGGMVQPSGKWSLSKSLSAKGLGNKMGHNHPIWGVHFLVLCSQNPSAGCLCPHCCCWSTGGLGPSLGAPSESHSGAGHCPKPFFMRLSGFLLSFKSLNRNSNCQLNNSNGKGTDREVKLGHFACRCQDTLVLQ